MINVLILILYLNAIHSGPIPTVDSLDWRSKNAILPVPEKSKCGEHAGVVSALDALSALIQIKTGELVQLSRQQVYDCSEKWCPCAQAGNASDVYDMIYNNLNSNYQTEEEYPYTGLCDHKCRNTTKGKYNLYDYSNSDVNSSSYENKFIDLLTENPLAIDVNADSTAFVNYKSGILDDPKCKGPVNHVLLLVGYGTEKGVDYWIARNSWGIGWGEKGYIRIVRNKNMCGVGNGYAQPTTLTINT